MNKNVLIASCTLDEATYGPVATKLSERGHEVLIFEADKVADGTTAFSVNIDNNLGTIINYKDETLTVESIGAAWYRRADHFYGTSDTKYLAIDSERGILQNGLWNLISDRTWLNAPRLIPSASKKLAQLDLAVKIGFQIPETVISNHWQPILDDLPEDIIFKSSSPLFYDDQNVLTMFTTPFENSIEKLPINQNPFPGIWQSAIKKAREWRITVVGDETFDAAIYTHESAKDDWRKHQLIPGRVDFRKEPFPEHLKERCIKYLGMFGLRFGAFDFIEDHEGEITFLECNPNGQFGWLEETLGLPITTAITDELVSIAKDKS